MAGEVAFIEFGVGDTDDGRSFYSRLFGWTFLPGPSGQGWVMSGLGVAAGMHGGDPGATPYVFFAVDDIEEAMQRVRALGGEVHDVDVEGGGEQIARFGRFKLCSDDQGSRFGLHERPEGF